MILPEDRFQEVEAEVEACRPSPSIDNQTRISQQQSGEDEPENIRQARCHKDDGNAHFSKQDWQLAIDEYRTGISLLPSRPVLNGIPPVPRYESDDEDDQAEAEESRETQDRHKDIADRVPTAPAEDSRLAQLRAVLNANIGASELKRERWNEAIAACTQALEDCPDYAKALSRRATANEKIDSWTSLSAALEDWKKIETLPDCPKQLHVQARQALRDIPPRLEERKTAETAEMMKKLKEMGNSILGKFGLSTDNFKMTPNGQGGYGMEFKR